MFPSRSVSLVKRMLCTYWLGIIIEGRMDLSELTTLFAKDVEIYLCSTIKKVV